MKSIRFIFIMFVAFISCKKKETPQPTPEELIVGKWSIFSITRSDMATPACELDNQYEFKESGLFIDNQGSNKCSYFYLSNLLGLWYMSDDYKKLTISYSDANELPEAYDILELTSNQMTIKTDTVGGFPSIPNIQRNIILKKVQ